MVASIRFAKERHASSNCRIGNELNRAASTQSRKSEFPSTRDRLNHDSLRLQWLLEELLQRYELMRLANVAEKEEAHAIPSAIA